MSTIQNERKHPPIGLKFHVKNRSHQEVEDLHQIGISVSLQRVIDVRTDFAKAVSKRWNEEEVVVPTNVCRGVFVTCNDDNLDQVDFHGTTLSMTGHPSK